MTRVRGLLRSRTLSAVGFNFYSELRFDETLTLNPKPVTSSPANPTSCSLDPIPAALQELAQRASETCTPEPKQNTAFRF